MAQRAGDFAPQSPLASAYDSSGNAVAEGVEDRALQDQSRETGLSVPVLRRSPPVFVGRSFVVDTRTRIDVQNPDDVASSNGMNRLIVPRRNKVMSNGVFLIGPSTDVLVEGDSVADTPSGSVCGGGMYKMLSTNTGTFLRDNCP
uniref:Uncharacterized protein n=1 Tax=Odontella aurita TaxID=265563 RepID=A0A7S4JH40_9STRA|mmetsp:Transcript_4643/g.13057  ORF Transcript_4643/g.13057 Transcript_4643/m.13057 type:complete len:145 (+) Transcript_4643:279-713(+)